MNQFSHTTEMITGDLARQALISYINELSEQEAVRMALQISATREELLGPEASAVLSMDAEIAELGLEPQIYNALWARQVRTVGDILIYSRRQLLRFRQIGQGSLAKIESALLLAGHTLSE